MLVREKIDFAIRIREKTSGILRVISTFYDTRRLFMMLSRKEEKDDL